MKKFIRANQGISYLQYCKNNASNLAEEIMEWQDGISGDPRLSDCLSEQDIITLDKARAILYRYSEEA